MAPRLILGFALSVAMYAGCSGGGSDRPPVQTTGTTTATGPTTTTSAGGMGGAGGAGGEAGMGGSGGGSLYPDTCYNGMLDPDEVEQDCGGVCGACGGDPCGQDLECASNICEDNECTTASCNDMEKNAAETGIDCGPGCSATCLDGEGCNDDIHCQSSVCENNLCLAPTCNDMTKNGGESGVDCGGTSNCGLCVLGETCTTANDCVSKTCTGGSCQCPDKMVISPSPMTGSYCIDKTEITYEEYEDFWSANPSMANLPAECSSLTVWTPNIGWPNSGSLEPVIGVNWCQAYGYCQWRSKRLCGKFGGGATAFGDFADASKSQWMNACSSNGVNDYPYGDAYNAGLCNGSGFGAGAPVEVQTSSGSPNATTTSCEGGSPDLWQMSGNVREWVDSCDGNTGPNDNCRLRGGSYLSDQAGLRCDANSTETRDTSAPDIGFRCCIGG